MQDDEATSSEEEEAKHDQPQDDDDIPLSQPTNWTSHIDTLFSNFKTQCLESSTELLKRVHELEQENARLRAKMDSYKETHKAIAKLLSSRKKRKFNKQTPNRKPKKLAQNNDDIQTAGASQRTVASQTSCNAELKLRIMTDISKHNFLQMCGSIGFSPYANSYQDFGLHKDGNNMKTIQFVAVSYQTKSPSFRTAPPPPSWWPLTTGEHWSSWIDNEAVLLPTGWIVHAQCKSSDPNCAFTLSELRKIRKALRAIGIREWVMAKDCGLRTAEKEKLRVHMD